MAVTYSQNLQNSLQRAVGLAAEQNRKYATPEDLLLALIHDPDAAGIMSGLSVDFERLRRDLVAYMDGATDEADETVDDRPESLKLTPDLWHIIQSASLQAQSSGRDVMTGADLLVELFTKPAGQFLEQQGVTSHDATRHMSRGTVQGRVEVPGSTSSSVPSAKVLLLNDDHTPMEFVVHVLERVFEMDHETAIRLMLEIHNKGVATCGVYRCDVAQAKVTEVLDFARRHRHPLQCVLERSTSA